MKPVGRMVLDRNPVNYFAEVEQAAFGTGVLVDGLEFSDDKMLQGRTLSYSDTQRYRVGPNYLQLPINRPKAPVATNQRDGQMTYYVDQGPNPHINYEPQPPRRTHRSQTCRQAAHAGSTTTRNSSASRSTAPTTSPRRAKPTATWRSGSRTSW